MRIVVIKDLKTGLYWRPYGSLDEWVNNPLEASDRSSYIYYEDANLFYKDDNYKLVEFDVSCEPTYNEPVFERKGNG